MHEPLHELPSDRRLTAEELVGGAVVIFRPVARPCLAGCCRPTRGSGRIPSRQVQAVEATWMVTSQSRRRPSRDGRPRPSSPGGPERNGASTAGSSASHSLGPAAVGRRPRCDVAAPVRRSMPRRHRWGSRACVSARPVFRPVWVHQPRALHGRSIRCSGGRACGDRAAQVRAGEPDRDGYGRRHPDRAAALHSRGRFPIAGDEVATTNTKLIAIAHELVHEAAGRARPPAD